MIGFTFSPQLLLEEEKKKTVRMHLISSASFSDILVGKLLVKLAFRVALTGMVMAIISGSLGGVPLRLLYVFLGTGFSLSLGFLYGSLFNSIQSVRPASVFILIIIILGGIFVGQLGQLLGAWLVHRTARIIPTYYLADGVINASQNLGSVSRNMLAISILINPSIL